MAAWTNGDKLRKILHPGSGFNVPLAGKWALKFIVVGLIAGLGSIAFHYLCQLGIHFFLDLMAGYRPPQPMGEHRLLPPSNTEFNRWILLLLPAVGGIVSGWLVYTAGGSGGREGPIAHIGACFGSYLTTKFKQIEKV